MMIIKSYILDQIMRKLKNYESKFNKYIRMNNRQLIKSVIRIGK